MIVSNIHLSHTISQQIGVIFLPSVQPHNNSVSPKETLFGGFVCNPCFMWLGSAVLFVCSVYMSIPKTLGSTPLLTAEFSLCSLA
jgi:hypothetical protein